jgi:hypothetical protein
VIPIKGSHDNEHLLPDIWQPYIVQSEFGLDISYLDNIRGSIFTSADRVHLNNTLKDITEKLILPNVSSKLRAKENHIQMTRKGFKNAFKAMWKKSERQENEGIKKNFKMN